MNTTTPSCLDVYRVLVVLYPVCICLLHCNRFLAEHDRNTTTAPHTTHVTIPAGAQVSTSTYSWSPLCITRCTPLQRAHRLAVRRKGNSLLLASNAITLNLHTFQPLPPGQKRVKEDWENIWYFGMFGSMALAAVLLYYKPDTRYAPLISLSREN